MWVRLPPFMDGVPVPIETHQAQGPERSRDKGAVDNGLRSGRPSAGAGCRGGPVARNHHIPARRARPVAVPVLCVASAAPVRTIPLLVATLRHRPAPAAAPLAPPRWDLPVRALCATGMVLGVTGIAGLAGPHVAGLLSPLPVFASVLLGFTH